MAEIAEPDVAPTVGDVPRLINTLDRFAAEHSSFESSAVGDIVRDQMAAAPDANLAALVPLRHKVFTFETALLWGFFLSTAVAQILEEDGVRLRALFDLARYYAELPAIYDIAVETNVWCYCDEDEDVSGE